MIDVFVSRPIKIVGMHEHSLKKFYAGLETAGFRPRTIGTSDTPLKTPFDEVKALMEQCKCSIILGFIKLTGEKVSTNHPVEKIKLVSEWNQIEATMSLMLGLPTLVLLQKGANPTGLFVRGAAPVFVHEFHPMEINWDLQLPHYLSSLTAAMK
jgi:hypothetical protein